jgi:hypothetical protein
MVDEPTRDEPTADEDVVDEPTAAEPPPVGSLTEEPTRPDGASPAADEDVVDELPEDLDAAGYVGPYLFPDNRRRRIPGYLYLVTAVACLAVWALVDDSPYVNGGFLLAGILLGLVGAYQIATAWSLDVDEQDALVAASRTVGFPIGHASAQLGWRGLLSRPTWRILVYSDENPPARRGLVLVDGHDGRVIEHFVEQNPEDWSQLDAAS